MPTDIAIVDIGMPTLSGHEVAREIRRRYGSKVYLVALTGFDRPDDQARAGDAGFDRFLLEPVDGAMFASICEGLHDER